MADTPIHDNGFGVAQIRKPSSLFNQLYAYLLPAGMAVTIFPTGFAILVRPAWGGTLLNLLALTAVWLAARTASVAGSVAAHSRNLCWLARVDAGAESAHYHPSLDGRFVDDQ